MDFWNFKKWNGQIKNSQSLPNFILAAPYENHSIKSINLPNLAFTVIRNSKNWRSRLLLWKLWSSQYFSNQKSIWLHWKRRWSATCWNFDSSILINIDQHRAFQTWKKSFCQFCQMLFWWSEFGCLPWSEFLS